MFISEETSSMLRNRSAVMVGVAAVTNGSALCHNSSQECHCNATPASNSTGQLYGAEPLDALLYIVVVLLFYAFSIVVLMIKYIRRENKEAYLRQYFEEFVTRDNFQSTQERNKICMKNLMNRHANLSLWGQHAHRRDSDLWDPAGGGCVDRTDLLLIPPAICELEEKQDEGVESRHDEVTNEPEDAAEIKSVNCEKITNEACVQDTSEISVNCEQLSDEATLQDVADLNSVNCEKLPLRATSV